MPQYHLRMQQISKADANSFQVLPRSELLDVDIMPWQTLMSVVLFVCWYFPIGTYRQAAGAHEQESFLVVLCIWSFMLFTSTLSQMVAAAIESGKTAVNIAQLLYSLSLIFCG